MQPMGLTPDLTRVGALGYSLGGFSALGLAGVQVSKAAFMAYCDRNPDQLDCGWMRSAGVDFTAIDQSRYDATHRDPRISVAVAIDPALPAAMTPESLARVALPVLIVNLGPPATLPDGLRSDHVAAAIPGARYLSIAGAHHFSALAECSGLGVAIIALAGDDNICSDFGHRPRAEIQSEMLRQIIPMLQATLGLPG
jgi:predicted dienelactone hydrolase